MWYDISNADIIDSPGLLFYPERIKENIHILKTFVSDVSRLRPHVKTNKCAEVCLMMMDGGIQKFKCSTIAEAEMLATMKAPDVLLAYQPLGPKGERMARLVQQFADTKFSCLIDNVETMHLLASVAKTHAVTLSVFIDLNVGMNRTGIKPENAFDLWQEIQSTEGLNFEGLHAYDGHLRDPDLEVRAQQCNDAFVPVVSLREKIELHIGGNITVVAGGTPTFPIHAKRTTVECSPGTFVLWDKGYQQILREQPFLFAGLVITRVISKPAENIICIDLGHKSIASENALERRVTLLNAGALTPIGHSEEHMVLRVDDDRVYTVGEVLYGVPYHICPTVALHESATVVTDGSATDTWSIVSRKRKLTI